LSLAPPDQKPVAQHEDRHHDVQQHVRERVTHAVSGQQQIPDDAGDDDIQHHRAAQTHSCVGSRRRQRPQVEGRREQVRLISEGDQPPQDA
jgi:hypothetical protein